MDITLQEPSSTQIFEVQQNNSTVKNDGVIVIIEEMNSSNFFLATLGP